MRRGMSLGIQGRQEAVDTWRFGFLAPTSFRTFSKAVLWSAAIPFHDLLVDGIEEGLPFVDHLLTVDLMVGRDTQTILSLQ